MLALIITVEIIYFAVLMIYGIVTQSEDLFFPFVINFWIYGLMVCLATVIQLYQIPLFIAGKYRDLNNPWELPLAG
jgi:hypothetical protein